MVAVTIDPFDLGGVRLRPHTHFWRRRVFLEGLRLRVNLPDRILKVHHVGGKAIRGVPAKPIIDIITTVRAFEPAAGCIRALEEDTHACAAESP